jgi:hypothetical protein
MVVVGDGRAFASSETSPDELIWVDYVMTKTTLIDG